MAKCTLCATQRNGAEPLRAQVRHSSTCDCTATSIAVVPRPFAALGHCPTRVVLRSLRAPFPRAQPRRHSERAEAQPAVGERAEPRPPASSRPHPSLSESKIKSNSSSSAVVAVGNPQDFPSNGGQAAARIVAHTSPTTRRIPNDSSPPHHCERLSPVVHRRASLHGRTANASAKPRHRQPASARQDGQRHSRWRPGGSARWLAPGRAARGLHRRHEPSHASHLSMTAGE